MDRRRDYDPTVVPVAEPELYHTAVDPYETANVAADYPQLVRANAAGRWRTFWAGRYPSPTATSRTNAT